MRQKGQFLVLAAVIGLVTFLIWPGAVRMVSPALAQPLAEFSVVLPASEVEVTDLSENPAGTGVHEGRVRCKNNCNQKTTLQLNGVTVEYRYADRLAIDPVGEQAFVGGTGSIDDSGTKGPRERFTFTATFRDNGDGTVWVRYDASRSDASFIVPNSPGEVIFSNQ